MHKQRIQELITERSAGEQESAQVRAAMLLVTERQAAGAAHINWVTAACRNVST